VDNAALMFHPPRGATAPRCTLTASTARSVGVAHDMALAMSDAPQAVTLAYDRHECDIVGSMNDAGETLLAYSTKRSTHVALRLWQSRNQAPLVHDSRAACVHV